MVCQAAGQTRFRALKHENGIAGSATIIVRVIACFQPLQDCQIFQVISRIKTATERSDLFWSSSSCSMEKDFSSLLLHQQHLDVQWLNAKSSALPFNAELQSISTPQASPGVNNAVSTKGNYPISALPLPFETNEPHGWFYHLPSFRQGFIPGANMVLNEKSLPNVQLPEKVPATTAVTTVALAPKQFLVFDQSGDKTTLMYSFGTGTRICLNSRNSNSKPLVKQTNAVEEKFSIWSEAHDISGPSLTDELNTNSSDPEEESEMREDTEEINALLYSDDESTQDEEYDDEVSTGHSPSIMTAYHDDKQDWLEVEDGEEVSSAGGPTKRQRISEDGYDVISFIDTASSAKPGRTFLREDDAESKCGNNRGRLLNNDNSDTESICGMKRSRKDKIREAVEILQSIIPGGQGKAKDPAVVLDESIRYLKSLKHKARSLGLSAL